MDSVCVCLYCIRLQPLAFLLQPMSFGVAAFLGPGKVLLEKINKIANKSLNLAIGGLTADPILHYNELFGPGSTIGGKLGVRWMMKYPFALPNIISTTFLVLTGVFAVYQLNEVCSLLPY